MNRSIRLMSFPMLLTLSLAAGSVAAEPPGAPAKSMAQEPTAAGEQLQNAGEETQHKNRHRVNENDPEQAKKVRSEQQGQDSEQSQPQQSGSQMGGSGGGSGGGGGRGR